MWLLSMNQRRFGSSLLSFLLCFLGTSRDCTAPTNTVRLQAGTTPLLLTTGTWGMGSLEPQKFLRKGDLRRSVSPDHQGRGAGGRNGQEKVLGRHRASLSCGNSGAAEETAAFPSPSSPSWSSTEAQASCLTSVVLSFLCSIILMFPNLRSITAEGKVARGARPARAEHPQRTAATKSEQRASTGKRWEQTTSAPSENERKIMKTDHSSFLYICLVSLSRFSATIIELHLMGIF